MTVRVNGAVAADAVVASAGVPSGDDANDRTTVFGSSLTLVDTGVPALSVAVSVSSRSEG